MSSKAGRLRPIRPRHGETFAGRGSPEYYIWSGMRRRCHDPGNPRFGDYGGRGIVVCERWREDLNAFIADMGRRPTPDHQLDRIDNDGPYSPENCRWATRTEQGLNKRNNLLLTLDQRTQPLSAWARELSLPYSTLLRRLRNYGWTDVEVLTTPIWGAGPERRDAARRPSQAQVDAMRFIADAGPTRRVDIAKRFSVDVTKMIRAGLLAKSTAGKYAPLDITPVGRARLTTTDTP